MKKNLDSREAFTALSESWVVKEEPNARYFRVPRLQFEDVIKTMKDEGKVLVCLFGVEDFGDYDGLSLLYVFEDHDFPQFQVLLISGITESFASIATIFPCANLFEREISDGFGIRFPESFDTRRLFLHESYPEEFHPLRRSFTNQPLKLTQSGAPYLFREIEGSSVYQVPVGPVHAGIIEPGHFRFSVIGEDIVNLEIRLGFLHRGVEKRAEGILPDDAIEVAESISGDESVVNACGITLAVEQICGIVVPQRAEYIRGILLELERAYTLLSDLAGMVTDIAYPVAASRFLILREDLQREADTLTGSRFMKGSICIGGVRCDISVKHLQVMFKKAGQVEQGVQKIAETVLCVPTVLDRFTTTGIVPPELIKPLALSGPIVRASGYCNDVRIDHPYGIYREKPPAQIHEPGGDVLARFNQKYQEILASLRYIQELILFVPEGPVRIPIQIQDGYALTALESPRGMSLHWIWIRNSRIYRYKVRTASFCNWYAIEHAVIGNIIPDFPLINKSLNLSYAGTDL
ncbi:MAG: NADH-quinone oxidoreductase subunit C [Methanobacteriota archaeon]